MRERALVTLATYNERENLPQLIAAILEAQSGLEVLVIDDNSPDGTGDLADQIAESNPSVHVLHRSGKLGLGSAITAGMQHAIDHDYAFVLNMDADFSHHPRYIPALLAGMAAHDVMIGSRYVPGGGVSGWPLKRKFMSKAINAYARVLLGVPARDMSGSFRCYRVECLKRIDLSRVLSRGYSFQQEILFRCRRAGCRLGETPIVFEDRRFGSSKINHKETLMALGILFWLGISRPFSRSR